MARISWDRLALALFFVAACLILATFTDYGVTWDEDVQNWYGVFVLDYYLSGFNDLSRAALPRPVSITAPVST